MSQQRIPTPEENEYKNLISFFKWTVSFAGGMLTVFASLFTFFTYSSGEDMRKSLEAKELALEQKITTLENKTTASIEKTNQIAQEEISRIKLTTNQLAIDETKKGLDVIFSTYRIEKFIEQKAIEKVTDKVDGIVDKQTKDIVIISDAVSQMRIGVYEGMIKMQNFIKTLPLKRDRDKVKETYNMICNDYLKKSEAHIYNNEVSITSYKVGLFYEKYPNGLIFPDLPASEQTSVPSTQVDKEVKKYVSDAELLNYFVNQINNSKTHLSNVSIFIILISKMTNQNFKPFEIEEITNWYKGYSKNNSISPKQP